MAKDLIPPPSPAGRPPPAGTPRLVELPPEPTVQQLTPDAPPAPAPKLPPSQFRNRFGFLMGTLAGAVVAAVLVAGIVIWQSGDGTAADEGLAANWSAWQPSDTSIEGGSVEIAKKVGAEYRKANGKQLVLVEPTAITDDGSSLRIALQPSSGEILPMSGSTVIYELNGLGPNMSILGGKPSLKRLQVLHREALELSLYTFRYLPDVANVVVMLPPPPPDAASSSSSSTNALATTNTSSQCKIDAESGLDPCKSALFYRPGDLKLQMQVPLGATVPAKAPTPENLGAAEGKAIDDLTLSNKFLWTIQRERGLLLLGRP